MITVLLTGATSGIGRAAAVQLARAGCRVLAVGRDPAKTARIAGEIRADAGTGEVVAMAADLGLFAMTRVLAKRGVAINIVDPGLVMTPYQERAGFGLRVAIKLF